MNLESHFQNIEYNRMDKKATEVIVVFNADTRHASIQYPQIPN